MNKKKAFSILALMAALVLTLVSCTVPATQTSNDQTPAEDDMTNEETMSFSGDAFNFDLVATDGTRYKLSELAGKKVYIKFWASWCSICLAGIEEFKELDAEFKDDDSVLILTVVSPDANGEMNAEKFKEWFNSQGYEFVTLLDQDGPTMSEYGIRGFPTSVYIDTKGNVFLTKIGHVDNPTIKSTLADMS